MITKKESACDSTVESRHRLMMLQLLRARCGGGVAPGTARSRSSWACQGVQHMQEEEAAVGGSAWATVVVLINVHSLHRDTYPGSGHTPVGGGEVVW